MVFRDDVKSLHPRWNIITSTFRNEPLPCHTTEQIVDALRRPGIAHYTGKHKPWMLLRTFHHPYSLAMRRYAAIAGQKRIYLILSLKRLFMPCCVRPKKQLPWDRSVIDRSLLR